MKRLIVAVIGVMAYGGFGIAQTIVPPPSNTWQFEWDAPTTGGAPTFYQVRYLPIQTTYTNIGMPANRRAALPLLADGAYTLQLQACNVTGCSPTPAALAFTVQTAVPVAVAPGPMGAIRLIPPAVAGVVCSPALQTVTVGQTVSFTASGGSGAFTWSAPGATTTSGSGTAGFSTTYAAAGAKVVSVTRGTSTASCNVDVSAAPTASLLFSNGWENRTETGCSWSGIVDALYDESHTPPRTPTNWDDFGGSGACQVNPPEAEIDTVIKHDGNRSLRVAQRPGEINGTDIRVGKRLLATQTEVTLIAYLRFADDYLWAAADHKNFIFMNGDTQIVYVNHRGQVGDATKAKWVLDAQDQFWSDKDNLATRGIWYRIRVHIKTGQHGSMEMFVRPDGGNEIKLNMTYEAGANLSQQISDTPISPITEFKLDTTYNAGGFITAIWYRWFDTVSLYSGLAQ